MTWVWTILELTALTFAFPLMVLVGAWMILRVGREIGREWDALVASSEAADAATSTPTPSVVGSFVPSEESQARAEKEHRALAREQAIQTAGLNDAYGSWRANSGTDRQRSTTWRSGTSSRWSRWNP